MTSAPPLHGAVSHARQLLSHAPLLRITPTRLAFVLQGPGVNTLNERDLDPATDGPSSRYNDRNRTITIWRA